MSNLRVIFTYTGLLGLVGMGYAMWAAVAPGEDRRKQLLKVSYKHTYIMSE